MGGRNSPLAGIRSRQAENLNKRASQHLVNSKLCVLSKNKKPPRFETRRPFGTRLFKWSGLGGELNLSSVLEDERIFALVSSHKSESFNSTPASPSPQTLLALRLDRSGSSKARCLSAVDSSWCSLCPGWVWRARMLHAKPRNRLELESRANSLSTYSCK